MIRLATDGIVANLICGGRYGVADIDMGDADFRPLMGRRLSAGIGHYSRPNRAEGLHAGQRLAREVSGREGDLVDRRAPRGSPGAASGSGRDQQAAGRRRRGKSGTMPDFGAAVPLRCVGLPGRQTWERPVGRPRQDPPGPHAALAARCLAMRYGPPQTNFMANLPRNDIVVAGQKIFTCTPAAFRRSSAAAQVSLGGSRNAI